MHGHSCDSYLRHFLLFKRKLQKHLDMHSAVVDKTRSIQRTRADAVFFFFHALRPSAVVSVPQSRGEVDETPLSDHADAPVPPLHAKVLQISSSDAGAHCGTDPAAVATALWA